MRGIHHGRRDAPPRSAAGLRNQLTDPPLWSASLAEIDPKHARTVLYLAAYVAAVDGEYDEAEVRLLRQMCEALDVKKKSSRMPSHGSNPG